VSYTPRQRLEVIADLRAEVARRLQPHRPGKPCRICDQRIHLQLRKLHSGMAYAAVRLYLHDQEQPGEFMDYRDHKARGESRNHPYLRYWRMIERDPERRGWWRIRRRGRLWVEERISVPRAMWYYNRECYGFVEERIDIREALGDKFNLDELLAGRLRPLK